MWIYTKNGFYSIVQDKTDPDFLIVRARVKGDIEALLALCNDPKPKIIVEETPDSDYRYRARIDLDILSNYIAYEVTEIDYPNFKDSISDKRRSPYYSSVWAVMGDMQDRLTDDTNKK